MADAEQMETPLGEERRVIREKTMSILAAVAEIYEDLSKQWFCSVAAFSLFY